MNRLRAFFFHSTKINIDYPENLHLSDRSQPEANKWVLSDFILNNLIPVVGVRPYPLDELLMMSSTLAYFKPDLVIDWGTHLGKSARVFYETAKYLKLQSQIHSVDLPPSVDHVENKLNSSQRAMFVRDLPVRLHLGDGPSVASEVLKELKPKLPMFFLDGDHSFASVQNELKVINSVTKRAVILVHDSFYQGPESGYNIGPFQALNDFAAQNHLPIQSTILGLPGMSLTYWL